MDPRERSDFLTLTEAAARLGVSRLKLREAIAKGVMPARRDNEGRLRVDLGAGPEDLTAATGDATASPEALMQALFEEIEELQEELQERSDTAARFASLAARQQEALERAAEALNASQDDVARLSEMLDRALSLAETVREQPSTPAPVTERALGLLEETAAALEVSRAENARLSALLSRAVSLAETASGAAQGRIAALTGTARRAMSMLERATTALETSKSETVRISGLLDRAMATNERLEAELAEKSQVIGSQERVVDKLFSLSESALNAAMRNREAPRLGLFHRMFGRRGPS